MVLFDNPETSVQDTHTQKKGPKSVQNTMSWMFSNFRLKLARPLNIPQILNVGERAPEGRASKSSQLRRARPGFFVPKSAILSGF